MSTDVATPPGAPLQSARSPIDDPGATRTVRATRPLASGTLGQRIRLVSGLVLFAYVLTHFANHALGLVSLEAMVVVQDWRLAVTRSWPGTAILLAAILAHVGYALLRIASRRTLRMPIWEAAQIATGLLIPLWLIDHIGGSRLAWQIFEIDDNYAYMLRLLWPGLAASQSLLLVIVWVHACIGLHFWLRLSPTYRLISPVLLALAVALPILALTGFVVGGREAQIITNNAAALEAMGAPLPNWMGPNRTVTLAWNADHPFQQLDRLATIIEWTFFAGLGLAVSISASRMARRWLAPTVPVEFVAETGGGAIKTAASPGATLLEVSRAAGIPHTSVCGGRARCSTCRVQVLETSGLEAPVQGAEAATLARIKAGPDVRLACQLRVTGPLKVSRLVRHRTAAALDLVSSTGPGEADEASSSGIERDVCVLFFDLRGFTALASERLPYDVVFLLNRLFEAVGEAIEAHGGWIDKYMGDGLMAVFGRGEGVPIAQACGEALASVAAIDAAMDAINARLVEEVGAPLRYGIGLHSGALVIGRIGHPSSAQMTVIGNPVNAAARLESLTKDFGVPAVISQAVLENACPVAARNALEALALEHRAVDVRGFEQPLDVVLVPEPQALAAIIQA